MGLKGGRLVRNVGARTEKNIENSGSYNKNVWTGQVGGVDGFKPSVTIFFLPRTNWLTK